jgi:hypothetical protein
MSWANGHRILIALAAVVSVLNGSAAIGRRSCRIPVRPVSCLTPAVRIAWSLLVPRESQHHHHGKQFREQIAEGVECEPVLNILGVTHGSTQCRSTIDRKQATDGEHQTTHSTEHGDPLKHSLSSEDHATNTIACVVSREGSELTGTRNNKHTALATSKRKRTKANRNSMMRTKKKY